MAQYDRTETPGEINLGTGILSDRQQAERWEVSPNFAHRVRPHTSVTGSYDFVAESLVDNGTGRMQVARAGLSQIVSARSTVSGVRPGTPFRGSHGCEQRERLRRRPRRMGPPVLAVIALLAAGGSARLLIPGPRA